MEGHPPLPADDAVRSPDHYFDVAIRASSVDDADAMLRLLQPRIAHVFSGAVDELALRTSCAQKPCAVVVDLNDIFSASLFKLSA